MPIIRRVCVPLLVPEDIIPHLGAPHHWKEGRSAKNLIDLWWAANAIPPSIGQMLEAVPEWQGAELIDAFAERCTSLDDGRPSHSQSDLLAIVGLAAGIGVLSIEAKVDEGFDKTVDQWLKGDSKGKAHRLSKLVGLLGVEPHGFGKLRYQLLHRTASAIIEAKRYRTRQAAMIVQSWCPDLSGLEDFLVFCEAIGIARPEIGRLTSPVVIDAVELRLGWSAEAG